MLENYGTIWVCQSCMLHHANGECGDCHITTGGHDADPLGLIGGPFHVAMGMDEDDHSCDAPDDYECGCGVDNFSRSQCEGCGSWLHGERHAMTLFKEAR